MSRIDELLRELSPEGVVYKPLGSVGTVVRGKRFVKTDMIGAGVPCIHYGEIYTKYGISATESYSFVSEATATTLRFAQPGDVIMASAGETVEDIDKSVAWLGEAPIAIHDACYAFSSPLDPTFVSYFFSSRSFRDQIKQQISSSKISSISTQNVAKARIPLPPMEVQREIVRILDSFSGLQADLELTLEAELQARRHQYAHYSESALASGHNAKSITLGEAVSLIIDHRGKTPKKLGGDWSKTGHRVLSAINIKNGKVDDNDHHYINPAIYERWMREPLRAGDVLLTSEAPLGALAYISREVDWAIGQRLFALRPNADLLHGRYLYHLLRAGRPRNELLSRSTGSTVSGIRQAELVKVRLDLPEMDVQRRIAESLDALEKSTYELAGRLSAERRLRGQQYEYYRDRLMTFEEVAA